MELVDAGDCALRVPLSHVDVTRKLVAQRCVCMQRARKTADNVTAMKQGEYSCKFNLSYTIESIMITNARQTTKGANDEPSSRRPRSGRLLYPHFADWITLLESAVVIANFE